MGQQHSCEEDPEYIERDFHKTVLRCQEIIEILRDPNSDRHRRRHHIETLDAIVSSIPPSYRKTRLEYGIVVQDMESLSLTPHAPCIGRRW